MLLSPQTMLRALNRDRCYPSSWSLHLVLQVDAAFGPGPGCLDAELEQIVLRVPLEPGVVL